MDPFGELIYRLISSGPTHFPFYDFACIIHLVINSLAPE